MMNEREILILQIKQGTGEWEDITKQVQWFDAQKNACRIKYVGNANFYWKSWRDLIIYDKPVIVDTIGKIVYCDKVPVKGVYQIIVFNEYAKLFFSSGNTKLVSRSDIKLVSDISQKSGIKNFIDYLKEIAVLMPTEDGGNFLFNQLDKLSVLEDCVLSKFLSGKLKKDKTEKEIIYPFDTNLSQRVAVKAALEEDLSIIKGPPGTGKTQTILNIVANYIAKGGSVSVVSGNNEATRNVKDKFEAAGFGYLNAFLGNAKNVETFFEGEQTAVKIDEKSVIGNSARYLHQTSNGVETYLQLSLETAKIAQLIDEYEVEKEINDAEYQIKERIVPKTLKNKKYTSAKLLELASVLETLPDDKVTGFFNRVRILFRFGIIRLKSIAQNKEDAIEYLKNKYYDVKISELNQAHAEKKNYIDSNNLTQLLSKQKKLSYDIFKYALQERYKGLNDCNFTARNYRSKFGAFTKRYPVVYSTTHAIRSCSGENYLYDCVIIDESSQVDLISAVIAFSMAKKVVLVGDEKQLPHVVKSQLVPKLNNIFNKYKLSGYYDYAKNSILSCVIKKEKKVASTLLNEHYRCDPQIIVFCNKRFYNGELVVRSSHNDGNGVTLISHGSHFERERENEREVDIIEKEIIDELPANQTGIIAPYNNQIALLNRRFENRGCVIDTIHKFQGKEKDNIIISTVDDVISDFADDSYLINVAVSRAKKRLILVVTGNEQSKERNITDLVEYIQYNNFEVIDSKIYSIFDYLYKQYTEERKTYLQKHKKISEYDSENLMYSLLEEILIDNKYSSLDVVCHFPLNMLIKDPKLLDEKECQYAMNPATHIDFLIYNTVSKKPVLAIEVDGYDYHKENTVQASRDLMKNDILKLYEIPLLRFKTNGSCEKSKIIQKLDKYIA